MNDPRMTISIPFSEYLRLNKVFDMQPTDAAHFVIEAALDATHGDAREALGYIEDVDDKIVDSRVKGLAYETLTQPHLQVAR
jgi:hypothetical protein